MSDYVHGVKTSEQATSILPPVQSSAGVPFFIGTAPVNMTDPSNYGKPVLCHNYDEAKAAFGYLEPVAYGSTAYKKHEFSICEFIKSHFAFFQSAPVVIVNVLNPSTHKTTYTNSAVKFKNGVAVIESTALVKSSLVLKDDDETTVAATNYNVAFDENGYVVISKTDATSNPINDTDTFSITADKLNPSDASLSSAVESAIALVEQVFPKFRIVPGVLLAPYFSESPTIAALLSAKAKNINGVFKAAVALIDAPTNVDTSVTPNVDYGDKANIAAWKNNNNVVDENEVVCWPKLNMDGVIYAMSTQLAGLIQQVDGENEDVPYVSPSNKNYSCTGAVAVAASSVTEILLGVNDAQDLNGNGIVTALNFIGGWKCWGNRTACYPTNTDVKDNFIPIRRMFTWIANNLVQNFWSKIDNPTNRRQIDTVLDSANMWLNGLSARQYILGGRVEFIDSENSTTDLMDGKTKFHVYITPPSPNREIDFVLEYDPEYLSTLFE